MLFFGLLYLLLKHVDLVHQNQSTASVVFTKHKALSVDDSPALFNKIELPLELVNVFLLLLLHLLHDLTLGVELAVQVLCLRGNFIQLLLELGGLVLEQLNLAVRCV